MFCCKSDISDSQSKSIPVHLGRTGMLAANRGFNGKSAHCTTTTAADLTLDGTLKIQEK